MQGWPGKSPLCFRTRHVQASHKRLRQIPLARLEPPQSVLPHALLRRSQHAVRMLLPCHLKQTSCLNIEARAVDREKPRRQLLVPEQPQAKVLKQVVGDNEPQHRLQRLEVRVQLASRRRRVPPESVLRARHVLHLQHERRGAHVVLRLIAEDGTVVAEAVAPPDIAQHRGDNDRYQDYVAVPHGRRHHRAHAAQDTGHAGNGREKPHVARPPPHRRPSWVVLFSHLMLPLQRRRRGRPVLARPGADVAGPRAVDERVEGERRVAHVAGQQVASEPDLPVGAADGHQGADADHDGAGAQQQVQAEAVDCLGAELTPGDVEQDIEVVRLRLLLLLPGPVFLLQPLCPLTAEAPALLTQHADVGPAQEGVAEGKDRHQQGKGAAHGHEDDGVGGNGDLVPDVGGEVARVGEL